MPLVPLPVGYWPRTLRDRGERPPPRRGKHQPGESEPTLKPRRVVRGQDVRLTWGALWAAVFLVCLPMVVYWPAIGQRFGFRDDYSVLRESHEEPGKVFQVAAMQARPVAGALLEASFRRVEHVAELSRLRLACAALFGVVAAALFLGLRRDRWDSWLAFLVSALVVFLPSTQIVVSWAVGWPIPIACLLGLAAFALVERSRDSGAIGRNVGASIGVLLVATGALIYPSHVLLYVTAMAGALWHHRRWTWRRGSSWLVHHGSVIVVGLAVAFSAMMVAFARGWWPASHRVGIEHDVWAKAVWFVREPLRNALGLIALNEDGGRQIVHRAAMLSGLLIAAGLACVTGARKWPQSAWWLIALVACLPASFAVNLIVADDWPAYRVLLPLATTSLILLAMAMLALGGRMLSRIGVAVLLLAGLWLARRQTLALLAQPQRVELAAVEAGARRIDPRRFTTVFVLTPSPTRPLAPQVFGDEFGSLSTNSDWVPNEMVKDVMREQHPEIPNVTRRFAVESGPMLPVGRTFDVVIDLRRMDVITP